MSSAVCAILVATFVFNILLKYTVFQGSKWAAVKCYCLNCYSACFFPSQKEPGVSRCEHRTLHQDQQLCRWAWPGGWDAADPDNSHLTVSPSCWTVRWLDLDKRRQLRWEELTGLKYLRYLRHTLFTLRLVYPVLSASKSSCWPRGKFTWLWHKALASSSRLWAAGGW